MENSSHSRPPFRIIHLDNMIIREWSLRLNLLGRVFAKGPIHMDGGEPVFRMLLGDETGYLHVKLTDSSYYSKIQVSNIIYLSIRVSPKNLLKKIDMFGYPGKWDLVITDNFIITEIRESAVFGLPKIKYSFAHKNSFTERPLRPINICGFVKKIPDEDIVVLRTIQSEEITIKTEGESDELLACIRVQWMAAEKIMEHLDEGLYVQFTGLGRLDDNTFDCSYYGEVKVFPSVESMMVEFWRRNSPLKAKKNGKNLYGF